MKKNFYISGKKIQEFSDPFIIAEAGVNHNGKLDLALELVEAAARAQADCVKFQTFKAEQVVTKKGEMADYQKKNIGASKSQIEMLKELELKEEFYQPIIKRCKQLGILFLSTPHGGRDSVQFLEDLNVSAYKVGSGDLTNFLLLEKLASLKKPLILSSGMAYMNEVKEAINFLQALGCDQITMLHCTTNYPCPPDEVNLAAMQTMMKELNVPVGYSDHTLGSQVAVMSTTLGSAVYECHFTLDKKMKGPDHAASADPDELKEKIEAIRRVALIMGSAKKTPNKSEIKLTSTVRKSIVAKTKLKKGHALSIDDLEVKRPGDGLPPNQYQQIIGKKLIRDIQADEQIKLEYLK